MTSLEQGRQALFTCYVVTAPSGCIGDDHGNKHWLEKLAPFDASPQTYRHNRTGEDNGDAHHKR